MGKRRGFIGAIWVAGVAMWLGLSVGCGDNRPKIRRPEKPTAPPDESMRLQMDTGAPQTTNPPTPTK
jgi:hypothetical protein